MGVGDNDRAMPSRLECRAQTDHRMDIAVTSEGGDEELSLFHDGSYLASLLAASRLRIKRGTSTAAK
jgi:hypothetical protein